MPVLKYFFGVVRWYGTDLVRLDRATRRIMRHQGAHQYSSAIERVNMPRSNGGRGIHGALLTWEKEVVLVAMYLMTARDELGSEKPGVRLLTDTGADSDLESVE